MRFYLPGDTTEFILGIRGNNNYQVNQALLDELLNDDNMIFFDGETDRFSPLKTSDDRYEYTDYVLYNLLTLDFKGKDVYYITGDFNIHSNIERFKKEIKIDIKTDLKPLIYPEVCMPQLLRNTRDRQHAHKMKLDLKYNVVSLNCTRKPHRIDLLRALQGKERFVYSYYPFEDEDQINSFFENDGEVELLNELTELNENPMERQGASLKERGRDELMNEWDLKQQSREESVPLEYIQSCIDLITEAYCISAGTVLTEKAFKPMLYKKPFIILGPRYIHQSLKNIGFKLYDELFDYSFDDKPYKERLDSIVTQIKEILKIPTLELIDKCKDLSEKIEYNYKALHKLQHIDMIDMFRDEGLTKSDLEVLEIFNKDQDKYVFDIR
jgi:hypothetical protein